MSIKSRAKEFILYEYGIDFRTNDEFEECSSNEVSNSNGGTNAETSQAQKLIQAIMVMRMVKIDGTPAAIEGYDYLTIGSIGSAYNKEQLKACGITHILCLADICRTKYPDDFVYVRVALKDNITEDLPSVLETCFNAINMAKLSGGRILCHCFKGVSRSAAVCCAYLIRYHNMSVDQAIDTVRRVRPAASPNSGFMKTLHDLYKTCNSKDDSNCCNSSSSSSSSSGLDSSNMVLVDSSSSGLDSSSMVEIKISGEEMEDQKVDSNIPF
jgi:atypical dual specificity phosphatase